MRIHLVSVGPPFPAAVAEAAPLSGIPEPWELWRRAPLPMKNVHLLFLPLLSLDYGKASLM